MTARVSGGDLRVLEEEGKNMLLWRISEKREGHRESRQMLLDLG